MDTKKLRQKILDLAIRGKLVPQDPNDEPASVLLERIRTEKERLIKEGKIKRSKKTASDMPHDENVPFDIPNGWCWCKLDDIVSFQGGFAYKSNTYVGNSNWQVIRIGNVKNDKLLLDNQPVFVSDRIGIETQKYLIKPNDILFSMTGTKGKRDYFFTTVVPFINHNLLLNQRVGCLRRFSLDVDINYLCLALKGEYVLDAIFATETGNVSQGNIGSDNTLNLDIALPPLKEQIRIVKEINAWISYIDLLDNEKFELETRIQQAKSQILDLAIHGKLVPQDPNDEPAIELLKRINPKFEPCDNEQDLNKLPNNWCWTNLGSIFHHNTGKALNKSDSQEGTLKPYLTTSNVYWNHFDFTEVKEMYFKDSELEKCTIIRGDLLVCEGGDIGRAAIWNYDYEFCIQNHLHKLRAKGQIDHRLYLYVLMLYKWTDRIHGKGIGLQGLSSGLLDKLVVPLPPYQEQLRIVAKIEELFGVLDELKESLER